MNIEKTVKGLKICGRIFVESPVAKGGTQSATGAPPSPLATGRGTHPAPGWRNNEPLRELCKGNLTRQHTPAAPNMMRCGFVVSPAGRGFIYDAFIKRMLNE